MYLMSDPMKYSHTYVKLMKQISWIRSCLLSKRPFWLVNFFFLTNQISLYINRTVSVMILIGVVSDGLCQCGSLWRHQSALINWTDHSVSVLQNSLQQWMELNKEPEKTVCAKVKEEASLVVGATNENWNEWTIHKHCYSRLVNKSKLGKAKTSGTTQR